MSLRDFGRAALSGCAVFALLFLSWPAWRSAYGWLFRASVQSALAVMGLDSVELHGIPGRSADFDTALIVREAGGQWSSSLASDLVGWWPTVFFLAACAATGFRRAFGWKGLWAGLLAVQLYVLSRVIVAFVCGLTVHAGERSCQVSHAAFLRSDLWRSIADVLAKLDSSPAVYSVIPILIWAASSGGLALVVGPEPGSGRASAHRQRLKTWRTAG
jgi:hypothetical protein